MLGAKEIGVLCDHCLSARVGTVSPKWGWQSMWLCKRRNWPWTISIERGKEKKTLLPVSYASIRPTNRKHSKGSEKQQPQHGRRYSGHGWWLFPGCSCEWKGDSKSCPNTSLVGVNGCAQPSQLPICLQNQHHAGTQLCLEAGRYSVSLAVLRQLCILPSPMASLPKSMHVKWYHPDSIFPTGSFLKKFSLH